MKYLLITIAAVVLVGCGPSMSIYDAALEGNIEVVKQHLDAGTDVNEKEAGETPLHGAALEGHKEVVQLLITNGADVNVSYRKLTPLHFAAIGKGHKEIVELLISSDADVNAKDHNDKTPLDWAIKHKRTEMVVLLRKHGGKTGEEHSIHKAAEAGNIEAVKQHLVAGTDVNRKNNKGYNALHVAAESGHEEMALLLIESGAKINGNNKSNQTPLHKAAFEGRDKIVNILIQNGANVNPAVQSSGSFNGMTPLDFALTKGKSSTADLLRKHGGKTGEELKAEGK